LPSVGSVAAYHSAPREKHAAAQCAFIGPVLMQ